MLRCAALLGLLSLRMNCRLDHNKDQTVLWLISGIWIFTSSGEETQLLTKTWPALSDVEICQQRAVMETCQQRVVTQSIKRSP